MGYFDKLDLTVDKPKVGWKQDCGELPVRMCRVDGGKLWRFLINDGYSADAADMIIREYLNINTYGVPIEAVVLNDEVNKAWCEVKPGCEIITGLKAMLQSECYNGTVGHLVKLIKEQEKKETPTAELLHTPAVCVALLGMEIDADHMEEYLVSKFGKTTRYTPKEVAAMIESGKFVNNGN